MKSCLLGAIAVVVLLIATISPAASASLVISEIAISGKGASTLHGFEVSGGSQAATAMIVTADPDYAYGVGHIMQQIAIPVTGTTTRAVLSTGMPFWLGYEGGYHLLLFDGAVIGNYTGKNISTNTALNNFDRGLLKSELESHGISLVDYASLGGTKTSSSGRTLTADELLYLNPAADLTHDDVVVPRDSQSVRSNWYRKLYTDGRYADWEARAYGLETLGFAELHTPEPATAAVLLVGLAATVGRRRAATT